MFLSEGESMVASRTPEIMADAAYIIISSKSSSTNGNFFMDDHVIASSGVKDLSKYRSDPKLKETDILIDLMS